MPSDLIALSNMPVIEEKPNGHLKTVSYQESPIMSTYLVAVVIGLFDYVEDHTPDGTIIELSFVVSYGITILALDNFQFTSPHRDQSSCLLSSW